MNVSKLKKALAESYATSEQDNRIPKFSTQFIFSERSVIIQVPIYEFPNLNSELSHLIHLAVCEIKPKTKTSDIREWLILAASGGKYEDGCLKVYGLIEKTSIGSTGAIAAAVTACVFSISFDS